MSASAAGAAIIVATTTATKKPTARSLCCGRLSMCCSPLWAPGDRTPTFIKSWWRWREICVRNCTREELCVGMQKIGLIVATALIVAAMAILVSSDEREAVFRAMAQLF